MVLPGVSARVGFNWALAVCVGGIFGFLRAEVRQAGACMIASAARRMRSEKLTFLLSLGRLGLLRRYFVPFEHCRDARHDDGSGYLAMRSTEMTPI